MGGLTAKLRAAYGRSTRPPDVSYQRGLTAIQQGFYSAATLAAYGGNWFAYVPNPELGPEFQQGGEGGLEVYLGTRGSLIVTRYNQTIDNVIAYTAIDSVRSLAPFPPQGDSPDADGYRYMRQFQYLNLGSLRNQGWELQGSINTGPLTTRTTYSWTKSRTIGITPRYRSFFNALAFPQYQPGATFNFLPEHTWAIGVTYAHRGTMMMLNMNGTGRATVYEDAFAFRNLNSEIRLAQNRLLINRDPYRSFNSGYTMADANASQRMSSRLEGTVQIQNLMNRYINDAFADAAMIGRQFKIGVRIR
jgi:outer membrane receptor for ferrienterochelin and colicin